MKFKSLIVTLLLVGALAFSMPHAQAAKKLKIGAAVYGLKGEFMRLWATALERHPDVVNGNVEITIFDGKYDASVQQRQFETMVAQGYDGIIFIPIDMNAGEACVDVAYYDDVPVVGSNTKVNSDNLLSYIGSDDVLGGYLEAKNVLENMNGKGNVVIIEGPIGQSAQIQRREGNYKAIKEYPGVSVIGIKTANWSRAEAMSLMENWLTAYPGKINGIIGQNDEMALGAIEAIKDQGFDPKDYAIAGVDGITDAINAVKSGTLGISILQNAVGQAQGALDILLRKLIGEEYKPKAEFWKQVNWGETIAKDYNVPWVPVNKDNADEILKKREKLTTRN